MKIGFVTRKNAPKRGGDLTALYCFYEGLKEIGQDVIIGRSVEELLHADFVFLSNTSFDLKEDFATIQKYGKRFGVVGFHSDRPKYYNPCYGFANFVGLCLSQTEGFSFYRLEQLLEDPEIIQFFSYAPPPIFEENYPILEKAEVCIATSPTEAATMQRDSPGCNAQVVYLECGIPDALTMRKNNAFLQWTGLKEGEYILQVGRIELRKNQLASILATKDLKMPLVLIATETFYPAYEQMCLEAIRKWRKAPTFVISQNLECIQDGNLRILRMPEGRELSQEMLISAYQNAGAHLHPAFCELPGLIYLEAAKLGVPTIASEWTAIKDYFTDPVMDDRIVYALPHHINTLTELTVQQFGKKFDPNIDHPLFRRTKVDVAQDFLAALKNIPKLQRLRKELPLNLRRRRY